MYAWKFCNETPCIVILNKQNLSFFKKEEQKGKIGPVCRLAPIEWGKYEEWVQEVNIVEILCTHV
jgi:hypothetical protein